MDKGGAVVRSDNMLALFANNHTRVKPYQASGTEIVVDTPNYPVNAPIKTKIFGKSEQLQTEQNAVGLLGNHTIPFTIGDDGKIDMTVSGTGLDYFWVVNGTKQFINSRIQLDNLQEDDVVWLVVNNEILPEDFKIDNNATPQNIKMDLLDLQGNLTYYLRLSYCSLMTGDLSSISNLTYYLSLANCSLIDGIFTPTKSSIKNIYLNGTAQTTQDVDQTIINISNIVTVTGGFLKTNARSSASDNAVATLKALGWTITCGGVEQ